MEKESDIFIHGPTPDELLLEELYEAEEENTGETEELATQA